MESGAGVSSWSLLELEPGVWRLDSGIWVWRLESGADVPWGADDDADDDDDSIYIFTKDAT